MTFDVVFTKDCTPKDIVGVCVEDPGLPGGDNVTVAKRTIARLRAILKVADSLGVDVCTCDNVTLLRNLTDKFLNTLDDAVL